MRSLRIGYCLCLLLCLSGLTGPTALAEDADDVNIFGYFQTEFQHERPDDYAKRSSFLLQHLNVFLQKDLTRSWTSFINFEFTNSFSANKNWGTLDVQEAWVRYRYDNRFNLKLGLQIPIFNGLNEIKNRTPILPYIIRPIVYESSLEEIIPIDQYVPNRAYVQAYGFLPYEGFKFDYALYMGNSPNINSDPEEGQTGVDTTDTFLFGGRVGFRQEEFKFGFSMTYDRSNLLSDILRENFGEIGVGRELGRYRLGGDLSYHSGGLFLEGELISVRYDNEGPTVDLDLDFYYATVGYEFDERWSAYVSYWKTRERSFVNLEDAQTFNPISLDQVLELEIPTVGLSCRINDRVTVKAQWARVWQEIESTGLAYDITSSSHYFALAISAFF
ncbi:porin [bacterium]|nr:porin [bacterium]